MRDLTPAHPRPGERSGRLCDNPRVALRPLRRPVEEFWATAPAWLRDRARLPMTPVQQALWEVLREPARLGTAAVARVPAWVAEYEAGYVLHFLLPEYGVNVQIDPWKPEYEREDPPDVDFEEDPDHPCNDSRDEDLRETFGIETIHLRDTTVLEMGVERTCEEVRLELGLAQPTWPHRRSEARPSEARPP